MTLMKNISCCPFIQASIGLVVSAHILISITTRLSEFPSAMVPCADFIRITITVHSLSYISNINKLNKCLWQMNKSLYNKIMLSVAKVVKESINEAYNKSIYDRYISSDDQSILNHSGNIGDIL